MILGAALVGCSSGSGSASSGAAPGITLGAASGNTDETGTTATFTLVLDAAPSANVTVTVSSSNPSEIAIQGTAAFTFTPANWNVAQTVTVIGVDDQLVDGAVNVTLTATAGSTGGYAGQSATLTMANADDGREFWPSRDNTLLEDTANNPAQFSNGAGQYVHTGRINRPADSIRRPLIAFDVAAVVPAGATITGATLRMNLSRGRGGDRTVELRRMNADWGAQGSDSNGNEGGGQAGNELGLAQTGDATWTNRFHDNGAAQWSNMAGGASGADFSSTVSASTTVGDAVNTTVEWTGAQLIADVQDMLDNPTANFGWIMLGDETAMQTVKRFDSGDAPVTGNRPRLLIDYTL